MDREQQTKEHENGQRVLRLVSIETVISVLVMVIGLGSVYGSLSTGQRALAEDFREMKAEILELRARDITPGAQSQISGIQATDRALQLQIDDMRNEMREGRREIRDQLELLRKELGEHDRVK